MKLRRTLLGLAFVFANASMAAEPSSGNKITNGDFSGGMTDWAWHLDNTAMAYRDATAGFIKIEIDDPGDLTHAIQVNQLDLTIVEGKQYAVYFDAKTTEAEGGRGRPSPRKIIALVGQTTKPWAAYSAADEFTLSTEMQRYSFTFTMNNPTDFRAQLSFQLGTDQRDIVLDNIALYDLTGGSDPTPPAMPSPSATYNTLIWAEEFNGPAIDSTIWNHETGGTGWGNQELQHYTTRPENSRIENGALVIEARKESYRGNQYTSARMTTEGKFEFQYGRVEARVKLPQGQGIWPAFWMLGANFGSVGWPACGEVDILEMVGGSVDEWRNDTVHGTIHWENGAGDWWMNGHHHKISNGILSDAYHTVSIVWDSEYIYHYLDGVQYNALPINEVDKGEFHKPFFLILNLAVGGQWPGYPDKYTTFPQRYYIDYIRVYQ